jgi:hypothetical protein
MEAAMPSLDITLKRVYLPPRAPGAGRVGVIGDELEIRVSMGSISS